MLKNFILKLLYSGQVKDVADILTNDKSQALLDYEKTKQVISNKMKTDLKEIYG